MCLSANETVLIQQGNGRAVILLAEGKQGDELLAVEELNSHLRQMAGTELAVQRTTKSSLAAQIEELRHQQLIPVLIGELALDESAERAFRDGKNLPPSSFLLRIDGQSVRIVGMSDEGTLFGVYELLEQLGCRWFMPGAFGTVIPEMPTVALPQQDTFQIPSFSDRHLHLLLSGGNEETKQWHRRARLGGAYFPGGSISISNDLFHEHPEYFALVNGQRTPGQHCISNPEVVQLTVDHTKDFFRKNPTLPWIGLNPPESDALTFCECDNCRALDGGDRNPLTATPSYTDRYIWFLNKIVEGISDEFPDKKVCFYAHDPVMRPPVRWKPNQRIVPAMAPSPLCWQHGFWHPTCPDGHYTYLLAKRWKELVPIVYDRGYFYYFYEPGFPFSQVNRIRKEIPAAQAFGLAGWRTEILACWGSRTPSTYLAAKLMWNAKADSDGILQDFYIKFFGPAVEPMKKFFEAMDTAAQGQDYHANDSANLLKLYSPQILKDCNQQLETAAKQATTSPYRERVAAFALTFRYLEQFLSMVTARNNFDFVSARNSLDQLLAIQKQAIAHQPPLLHPTFTAEWLDKLWSQTVIEGYARTTGGNRLVAALPDTWQFLIDPEQIGEELGYWRDDLAGGNWQSMHAYSATWSDQGLRYYRGPAWYRAQCEIPTEIKGQRVFLWIGGAKDRLEVWLNGKHLGTAANKLTDWDYTMTAEFDVTDVIRPGVVNTVVIQSLCQQIYTLNRGLTGPVMFYSKSH